jgi:hypothetical protein
LAYEVPDSVRQSLAQAADRQSLAPSASFTNAEASEDSIAEYEVGESTRQSLINYNFRSSLIARQSSDDSMLAEKKDREEGQEEEEGLDNIYRDTLTKNDRFENENENV